MKLRLKLFLFSNINLNSSIFAAHSTGLKKFAFLHSIYIHILSSYTDLSASLEIHIKFLFYLRFYKFKYVVEPSKVDFIGNLFTQYFAVKEGPISHNNL